MLCTQPQVLLVVEYINTNMEEEHFGQKVIM